jgi:hypothetical protein
VNRNDTDLILKHYPSICLEVLRRIADIIRTVGVQVADYSGRAVLWHELPYLARKLESWVRIPLKAWMSVCVYSVFVLFCVYVAAL